MALGMAINNEFPVNFHKQENAIKHVPKKARADVLLVYPVWVRKGGLGKLQRMLPPLGILSIAAYLEQYGYEVHVIDLHAEAIDPSKFRGIVSTLKPRFVGITVLSAHFIPANYIAHICKEEINDVKTIVGGVHAEIETERMLCNPYIDAVCRGDGEELMLEFVQGKPWKDILGLSFRYERRVVHNSPRPAEVDLDKFPFPAYHLINFDNYFPPVGSYRNLPAMNALMTRGCPGRCAFCNSAKTTLRSRSPEKMIQLIKILRYKYKIRQIYFYDDTFTSNPKVVRQFCEKMIADKIDVKWICYVRGDMFNDSIAELMAKAGCHQILIGIESGSPTLMAKIGKPIKKSQYKRVVDVAHKYGIEVRGSFIIGHLDETTETMKESVQFAIDIDLDLFQLNILTPYPGTQLFKEAKQSGWLLHERYERYGQSEVILKLRNLTADEVVKFERKAFYQFYCRPRAIFRLLAHLSNWHQLKDLFKAAYVIFVETLFSTKKEDTNLQSWLDYDTESEAIKEIMPSNETRLTYEVRQ